MNDEHSNVFNETKLSSIEKEFRLKRDTSPTKYYVKYLVVVDRTTVELFNSIYGDLGEGNIEDYIKIQYQFVVIQVKLI